METNASLRNRRAYEKRVPSVRHPFGKYVLLRLLRGKYG